MILPRLEAIADKWAQNSDDTLLHQYIADARRLADVLRFCVEKHVVPLLFRRSPH